MSSEDKNKTKDKILQEAKLLFSKFGYEGTSIRTIADKSKVNIAAINYHFKNKHGLYWSVLDSCYVSLENGVTDVVANSEDIVDLARKLFRFMRSTEDDIRSTMKTLLTEGVPKPDPEHPVIERMTGENFGPPGGDAVADFLGKQYKEQVSPMAIAWAVHCLFSSIVHWATMCSTSTFQEIKKDNMSDHDIEESSAHLARAIASYMCAQTQFCKK